MLLPTTLDALRTGYFDNSNEDVNVAYLTFNGKYKEEELQANALLKYFEDFSTVILIG